MGWPCLGIENLRRFYITKTSRYDAIAEVLICAATEVRRDHRVSGRQGPAKRTRRPTRPHHTASRTLARLHIGPDADHGAWSSRRGHPRLNRRSVLEQSLRSGQLEARRTASSVVVVIFWLIRGEVQRPGLVAPGYDRYGSGLRDRSVRRPGADGVRPLGRSVCTVGFPRTATDGPRRSRVPA